MNNALITGASQGIGKAFAQELASRKTNLVLVARSQDKLQELAKKLESQEQIKVEVIPLDLTAPGACQQLYQEVSELGIEIDLLINNAGFGDYGAFSSRKLAKQLEMIQLNITALVELTYLFLGEMQQRQRGAILNISSIAGFQPLPYLSTYAATKAFVLSFSESLWAENRTTGVKIMAVCPGPTESNFSQVAEFPQSTNSQSKAIPAIQVVKEALEALENDQSTVVTGGLANQVIVNLPRFFPRKTLVGLVEKQFRSN